MSLPGTIFLSRKSRPESANSHVLTGVLHEEFRLPLVNLSFHRASPDELNTTHLAFFPLSIKKYLYV